MITVFDIAVELVQRNGSPISALRLQKLCFYTFGWYAHLTGEALFEEQFYAMEYGPVVGELLSAHAGRKSVDLETLKTQQRVRDDEPQEIDTYTGAVIDAVWDTYGSVSTSHLVDMTHEEAVWSDAWHSRTADSKRASLPSDAVVSYFVGRPPIDGDHIELPPPMISVEDPRELMLIERSSQVHQPFVDRIRSLEVAS